MRTQEQQAKRDRSPVRSGSAGRKPGQPQASTRSTGLARALGNRAYGEVLQPKLRVGVLDDGYEREAERVADAVMRMSEPNPIDPLAPAGPASGQRVQRQCAGCEDQIHRQALDEKKESVQVKEVSGEMPEAAPEVRAQIDARRGGGQPLPESLRTFFQLRFGHDFSDLRMHTGLVADSLGRHLNARAFTTGKDIFFRKGEYAPETRRGRRLLAHELAHVVQQRRTLTAGRSRVQRMPDRSFPRLEEFKRAMELETVRQAVGEGGHIPVNKPGRVARHEWNIRSVPDPATESLRRLKLNDAVFVDSMTRTPGATLAWYHVVTERGETGWMRSDGIALDPPEPGAILHYVEADDKLINIAGRHYRSEFRGGQDARFYVAALAFANRGREGIIMPPGFTERDWQRRTTWEEIGVRRDHAIWIPDASFLRRLRGKVSSGSITGGLWAGAMAVAEFVWDWTRYGAGVIAGILRGAMECLYDLFAGAVHLVQAVWSVLKSLVTGNIVSDARALWDAVVNLDLTDLREAFVERWNASNPWERGVFRGRVIGYVAVEIALAFFSVGVLTAVKWTGRFARVTSRLASVRKVEEVAAAVSRSGRMAEVPQPAAGEMRRRFEGGGPPSRQPQREPTTSTGERTTGGTEGRGVHVHVTPREAAAIGRLQETLRKGGRWNDLARSDRSLLGNLFHKSVEPLAEFIFRGVGRTLHRPRITRELIEELRQAGGRVLFTEGQIRVGNGWRRMDLAEIDFARNRITVIDLTSVDRAAHVAKTRSYGDALHRLTGMPATSMEMRYVGNDHALLTVLSEVVIP
jgi:hypothetical protein